MGLDMYALATKAKLKKEVDFDTINLDTEDVHYWRKHPNLHGWMEKLWHKKRNAEGNPVVEEPDDIGGSFNGIELELTYEDLDELERAVVHGQLPPTQGFFFGNDADEHYRESDLEFIKNARAELFMGLKVFYNSSW